MPSFQSTWVVYEKAIDREGTFPAVCPMWEWQQLQKAKTFLAANPRLVQTGFPSEAEAEQFARQLSGADRAPVKLTKPRWAYHER